MGGRYEPVQWEDRSRAEESQVAVTRAVAARAAAARAAIRVEERNLGEQ